MSRIIKTHTLKIWSEYFIDVQSGLKTFEIRKNDRDFQVGDWIVLLEYNPYEKTYTGKKYTAEITYLFHIPDLIPQLHDDWVVMSIKPINECEPI